MVNIVKETLLKIAAVVAIPFLWLLLAFAEIYLDLTNIKGKGKNRKDG